MTPYSTAMGGLERGVDILFKAAIPKQAWIWPVAGAVSWYSYRVALTYCAHPINQYLVKIMEKNLGNTLGKYTGYALLAPAITPECVPFVARLVAIPSFYATSVLCNVLCQVWGYFFKPKKAIPAVEPSKNYYGKVMEGVDRGVDILCKGWIPKSPWIWPVAGAVSWYAHRVTLTYCADPINRYLVKITEKSMGNTLGRYTAYAIIAPAITPECVPFVARLTAVQTFYVSSVLCNVLCSIWGHLFKPTPPSSKGLHEMGS
jgi:hypothetical protein